MAMCSANNIGLPQLTTGLIMPFGRFIRTEADDAPDTWEVQLARKYYEKLFREYCIADLSHAKQACQ